MFENTYDEAMIKYLQQNTAFDTPVHLSAHRSQYSEILKKFKAHVFR